MKWFPTKWQSKEEIEWNVVSKGTEAEIGFYEMLTKKIKEQLFFRKEHLTGVFQKLCMLMEEKLH